MLNTSAKFQNRLFNDQRNYLAKIAIHLTDTDQTVLNLTNQHIWANSLNVEDAVSSDEDLQVGTAIINKASFSINNIYGDYSRYDFKDAKVYIEVGLDTSDDDTPLVEYLKKGTFYVDTADYNDTFIMLECLDGMSKLEKPYKTSTVTYPATAETIVNNICTACGVIFDTTNFPHKDYVISNPPDKDTCTYREVLAWVAQVCGCFARFNANGHLDLKWYDRQNMESVMEGLDGGIFDTTASSSYESGDAADGGTFNPWNTGYEYDGGSFPEMLRSVHFIISAYSHSISVDDVVITGVRILVKTKDEDNTDIVATHLEGTVGYVVEISDNPFITEDNVDDIIAWLGTQLIGLRFRKANLSIPSDPSIEAGDVAIYWDRKGNYHNILVSRVSFTTGEAQTIVSSAQTPARNSAERYSAETKNYVATKKLIQAEKSARELMFDDLQEQMANASGMYSTEVTDPTTQAVTTYYHNKPLLADSDIRIVISNVGITVTNNGTDTTPTWYGLEVNGTMIANILSAIGVNADWINTGKLIVKKIVNGTEIVMFCVDCDTKTFYWNSDYSSMSSTGVLNCTDATITGVLTAENGSRIGEMKAGINSSTPCFYSGNRTNYNVDSEGICIESNGNFGASGRMAFWSRTGISGDNKLQMLEWTNSPINGTSADSSYHLRISVGTTITNQVAKFVVDCLTGALTIAGLLTAVGIVNSGSYKYGNRTAYNARGESGYMFDTSGIGGGNGTADGTSAGWWELYNSGEIKASGELVSEKRDSSNNIQGYVSVGQAHSNAETNNAICVWRDSEKFVVKWNGNSAFTRKGTYTSDGIVNDCTGVVNINGGNPGTDSAYAFEIIRAINTTSTYRFYVTWAGYVYAVSTNHSSDERHKDIIGTSDHKNLFMALRPVDFKWKKGFSDDGRTHIGVGAQTLEKQLKEFRCDDFGLVTYDEKNDAYSVNYIELLMLSVPVVQEHERKIAKLEAENKSLKEQIGNLETRLARLEAMLNGKEGETKT